MEVLTVQAVRDFILGRASLRDKNLPSIGPINSNSISFSWVLAQVFDMSQNMTATILAHEISKVCTEPHVCGSALSKIPLSHGDSLKEEKSLSINQILTKNFQPF